MVVSREDRIPGHETALRKMYIYGSITLICMMHDQVLHHLQVLIRFSFATLGMLIVCGDESFDADFYDERNVKALAVPWGNFMGLRPSSRWFFVFRSFDLGISQAEDIARYRGCRSAPL